MDFSHKLISVIFPVLTIIFLLFFLPPYLIFKLISYIFRSFFPEDVAGKVILITGASSGIGEHLAYEYARKGARLALVARREDRLTEVADKARRLGSPDVLIIPADVSKPEDCKSFINEAVKYFGRLYGAHFAVPHLRKNKGKIIVMASIAGFIPLPKHCFYSAAKAALISFYEALRVEFGSDIGITIVFPGLIYTDMVLQHAYSSEVQTSFLLGQTAEGCAKSIVRSACRGDAYLTEPFWYRTFWLFKMLCPDLLDSLCLLSLIGRHRSAKKTS
ncbi:hypothetical protein V6N12_064280 [Hibiscus sabdariffa]|uniref:Uncharacterized protein n=1 Tax=Hibiscus sabdariffa TaxID=183260 RepID=A0ABR2G5D4_9ROSI